MTKKKIIGKKRVHQPQWSMYGDSDQDTAASMYIEPKGFIELTPRCAKQDFPWLCAKKKRSGLKILVQKKDTT